jgi:hypothetical protein
VDISLDLAAANEYQKDDDASSNMTVDDAIGCDELSYPSQKILFHGTYSFLSRWETIIIIPYFLKKSKIYEK